MKRVALETVLWVVIVLVYLGNSKSGGRTLLGSEEINVAESENEREKYFIEWVERVGSRIREQTRNASQVNESESESESEVAALVITVDENAGQYKSVQAAIDAVPSNNNQRVVIQIAAGIYEEKVVIPKTKAFITFEGAGAESTIITWYDTAGSAGSTHDSASVAINSDYFIGKGVTFKNSATPPSSGAVNQQAVALRISGDKASFFNCNFLGAQDTLYDDKGRHYFENCYIEGSVDFICGDGQSLYKGCNLHAISSGSLTAQSRESLNEDTGFSFVDCKVTGSGMLYLGRAWGRYSRVVFSYTDMDNIIIPQGWYDWGDASRQNVFYGEYKCSGPGAYQKGRVAWAYELSDVQAAPFQTLSFVDGGQWLQP